MSMTGKGGGPVRNTFWPSFSVLERLLHSLEVIDGAIVVRELVVVHE